MGDKKENLKGLFSNTRTRLIIVFFVIIIIVAIVIGMFKMQKHIIGGDAGSTVNNTAQGIESIPGGLNPTQQYSKLQNKQNVDQAKAALSRGESAIPTIIKSQKFGKGINVIGSKDGTGSVGFATLAREQNNGGAKSLWEQELKDSSCAKKSVQKVMEQGASLGVVKQVCSCQELKSAGIKLDDLKEVCNCKGLRKAGYNAMQLKNIGYNASQLRSCGFDACALKNAGFTAQELRNAGFTDGELKGAGFNVKDRQFATGIPAGMTAADILKAGCSPDALKKLRSQGVTARAIREISGCSPSQLKAAGYPAAELRNAGFTAAELRRAGFTPSELRKAGYNAHQLLEAGYPLKSLEAAGYSPSAIDKALDELPSGVTPGDVKKAGCSLTALRAERRAGVSAAAIRKYAHCSAEALAKAGFSDRQLKYAGFTPNQIDKAHEAVDKFINLPAGVTGAEVNAAGCDVAKIRALRRRGVSAQAIRQMSHCSADVLKKAGYSADALLRAGYTPSDLEKAGFTPAEIKAAQEKVASEVKLPPGVSYGLVKKAGCDVAKLKELRAKGVTAKAIRKINHCTAEQLKAAGYDAADLMRAGFTKGDLEKAGFTPEELAAARNMVGKSLMLPAGVTPDDVIKAGCNPEALKKLRAKGVSAAAIHIYNHCSAAQLRAAGYTAAQLKKAGFSDADLEDAGFSPADIAAADLDLPPGVTAADVQQAGCNPSKLRALRIKGVSATAIQKLNGCPYDALEKAGFTPAQIENAKAAAAADALARLRKQGCTRQALKEARRLGLTALNIRKTMGCTAKQLRAAGYSLEDLKDAGFTPGELRNAGYTAAELAAAGFSPSALSKAGITGDGISLPPGVTQADVEAVGCDAAKLKALREKGVSAAAIHKLNGCSASQLRAAGFSNKEIQDAGIGGVSLPPGVTESDVKAAGCNPEKLKVLREKGVSAAAIHKLNGCGAAQLQAAGFTNSQIAAAGVEGATLPPGITEDMVKAAGCAPQKLKELRNKGVSAAAIRKLNGCSAASLKAAGFSDTDLAAAGFTPTEIAAAAQEMQSRLPGLGDAALQQQNVLQGIEDAAGTGSQIKTKAQQNSDELAKLLQKQQQHVTSNKYRQEVQQAMALMTGAATKAMGNWTKSPTQSYTYIGPQKDEAKEKQKLEQQRAAKASASSAKKAAIVKAGKVIFAVLDTSINSDEEGPVLATVVSGRFKGAKLIGAFTLPNQGEKLVLNFNLMSVPGAPATTNISAVAIDPNTARTALSSRTDNHYLLRYGSLFASSFLEGFGNAFQSAGTTITVGGTTASDISVQQGVGRSLLENAVIGLSDVGKRWGQQAQQIFNRKPTVYVYSGTGLGILFTQDLTSI